MATARKTKTIHPEAVQVQFALPGVNLTDRDVRRVTSNLLYLAVARNYRLSKKDQAFLIDLEEVGRLDDALDEVPMENCCQVINSIIAGPYQSTRELFEIACFLNGDEAVFDNKDRMQTISLELPKLIPFLRPTFDKAISEDAAERAERQARDDAAEIAAALKRVKAAGYVIQSAPKAKPATKVAKRESR